MPYYIFAFAVHYNAGAFCMDTVHLSEAAKRIF